MPRRSLALISDFRSQGAQVKCWIRPRALVGTLALYYYHCDLKLLHPLRSVVVTFLQQIYNQNNFDSPL